LVLKEYGLFAARWVKPPRACGFARISAAFAMEEKVRDGAFAGRGSAAAFAGFEGAVFHACHA
jgi:hypothetical protein